MDIYDKILETYIKTEESPRKAEIELLKLLISFMRDLEGYKSKDEVAKVIIFILSLLNECHPYEKAQSKDKLNANERELLCSLIQQEFSNN